jgi:hypothetical protein
VSFFTFKLKSHGLTVSYFSSDFAAQRPDLKSISWSLELPSHPIQTDNSNCGVFIAHFLESLLDLDDIASLDNHEISNLDSEGIQLTRQAIVKILKANTSELFTVCKLYT